MKVFVVDVVRTPVGNKHGVFKDIHAADLGALPLLALAARNDPAISGSTQLVMGCATPIGEQGMNIARSSALAAGWPDATVATTVDAGANSGMRALGQVWAQLHAGITNTGIAGAVASMSRVPVGATAGNSVGKPFGPSVHRRFEDEDGLLPPGLVAEALAAQYGLSREALDAYALQSVAALVETQWKDLIVPVETFGARNKSTFVANDEKPAVGSPMFAPIDFVPAFSIDGVITAGNFAGPADGAVAVLLANENAVTALNLTPIAELVAMTATATNPNVGSSGSAIFAAAIKAAGFKERDIRKVSVHEDSAATVLGFKSEHKSAAVNANGGALGLGDPLGAGSLITFANAVATMSNPTAVIAAGASGQQDCAVLRPA